MNIKTLAPKAAAVAVLACAAMTRAAAATTDPLGMPTLSVVSASTFELPGQGYSLAPRAMSLQRHRGDQWNTLLILSAIILVVGLADDDGALVLIGGLGVAFSLIEQNGGGYFRYGTTRRGVDLYKTGSLSFGVTPVAPMGTLTAFNANRPSPYIQMTFKF